METDSNSAADYHSSLTLKMPILEKYPLISSLVTDKKVENPFLFSYHKYLLSGFSVIAKVGSSYTTKGFKSDIDNVGNLIKNPAKFLLSTEQVSAKKGQRDYVKEKFNGLTVISPRKYKMILGKASKKYWGNSNNSYIGLLNLVDVDKKLWRQIITEWQAVEQEL
jgi:hypothetical protein